MKLIILLLILSPVYAELVIDEPTDQDVRVCQGLRMASNTDSALSRWMYLCKQPRAHVCETWRDMIRQSDELAQWRELCAMEATETGCQVEIGECAGVWL